MDTRARRPSASLVVSFIALVIAISGTAVALPGKNKVETNDLEKKAVTAKKIASKAVTTKKLKNLAVTSAKLAENSVDGTKVVDNSIGDGKLSEVEVIGGSYLRATATEGADAA